MFRRSYILGHEDHPHYFSDSKLLTLQTVVNFSAEEEERLRINRNLSDPTKLKIYLLLQQVEEIPVSDLTQILRLSQSAVSHALADLKALGLVEAHRCGQLTCYSLKNKKSKLSSFFKGMIWR